MNTKIRYGLRMVLGIARENRVINTSKLGNEIKVSSKYLRKLAGPLEKAAIIKSVQGIYGGYVLNKKPEEITIKMIMDAFDEKIYLTDCLNDKKCPLVESCLAKSVWEILEQAIQTRFLYISIKDILERKLPAGSQN